MILFEQTFKNIDDILHKDAGCSSELDYVEQTSWILFLKYLDDFEKDKKTAAEPAGKPYAGIISLEYRGVVAQNREISYFFTVFHGYIDKRVKVFILLLWQKYYIFLIQSIA